MYGPNTDIDRYRQYNVSDLAGRGPRDSSWRNLVADIETLLRRVSPAIIAAPHPQLDTHRDHQFTTVALVEAMARWRRDATLLLYTNHADGNRYPYGPAGTLVSLPPTSQPVELDRVYSLPVSAELQRRKLFALESMHDLRYTPTRQYQLALGDGRTIAPEKAGPGPDITYLRRGPRTNELFFVYDQNTIRPMIEAFLAPWRAKGVGPQPTGAGR
jgi:LmbE family N-acetylglucosaminyl deacetylase